jgi:purine-binding chemotaxis protein CheW
VSPGYVLFRVGEQTFALSLDEVREIVRFGGLVRLPAARPPLVGVIVLRGAPLPVLDVREGQAEPEAGDVLVVRLDGDPLGVAVDQVMAVASDAELPAAAEAPATNLPGYVVGVLRHASGPVLLVDLQRMLDATANGWAERLRRTDLATAG